MKDTYQSIWFELKQHVFVKQALDRRGAKANKYSVIYTNSRIEAYTEILGKLWLSGQSTQPNAGFAGKR